MANRKRTNPVQFYLDDEEQYILDEKFKLSGMKSKSAFLRKLILYGYVYDVDYSYLRNYNTELGRISSNLNQIAKRVNSTGNIYGSITKLMGFRIPHIINSAHINEF